MAKQNAQQPPESPSPESTALTALTASTVDQSVDRIFSSDPDTVPVLRRRQPTVIPKLQGRQPTAPPPFAPPLPASQPPVPPDPERAARKKLLWLSTAAGVAVVMIAAGVLLSVRSHGTSDEPSVALPDPAATASSTLAADTGVGSAASPIPVDSLGVPTEAATRTAAPRSAKPSPTKKAVIGLPNTAGVDLALNKPVTVSGSEGDAWPASEAVDGDPATRWSSAFSDPQWIRIDLGALRQIKQVKLIWERSYAVAFQVQTSAGGSTWKTVYSTTVGAGGTQTIKLSKTAGRYLRVYGTKRISQYGYSIFEIDVR